MSGVATHLDAIRTKIFEIQSIKPIAEKIEEKTKVNVEYFAVGIAGVLALCIFSGFCANFIINCVGFTYPAYRSLVAIESSSTDDDTQWLMYWVVFGTFCLFENVVHIILYWIPFYYPIKLTFLLWCMLPNYQGAKVVYSTVQPFLTKGVDNVDAALKKSADAAAAATEKTD